MDTHGPHKPRERLGEYDGIAEVAVLDGGPADGVRMRVMDRPSVVQVTYPCEPDGPTGGAEVGAFYVYRRDPRVRESPLRYGYDRASP
ncbi:hypothetical protein GCM10009654_06960 [Streptomyces hebeiensis]|uniref:Uncharacterized protein n=1 Tax=Streptomyces hebeiensis TaxID=229486 RepID=A0ABN1UIW7_9ACTN